MESGAVEIHVRIEKAVESVLYLFFFFLIQVKKKKVKAIKSFLKIKLE